MSRDRRCVAGLAAAALGVALLAWVLYDAGDVREALRLGAIASEATVAVMGLALGLVAVAAGGAYWRRARAGSGA